MGFERPSQQHSLVLATIGVTIAFAAAAVAGQIVFRSRFGPAAGAAANDEVARGTSVAGTTVNGAATINDQRLALAAGRLSDGSTTQAIKVTAAETAQLAMNIPTTEQIKQEVQAAAADATAKAQQAATAAAQEKWDEVKANTAAAALEAATTAGAAASDKLASSPINDLKSPEAQRQVQAVGAASVSLWQSLWQVFVSIWQAIVGLLKK